MSLRVLSTALLSICLLAGARMSAAATDPCAAPEFRQFDFWVGRWDVVDAQGKPAGRNEITIEERGCVVIERWKSASGGTGQSMNYYDPRAKLWTQHWVGAGVLLTMTGGLREGAMVMQGPMQYLGDGRLALLRGTWTQLPNGRLRQRFEESADDGRTWTEWFDGYYSRIP